jgi:hypothetical protein
MKYLKRFNEEVDNKSIKDWCKKLKIENCEIDDNGFVDVNGDVDIASKKIIKIPVKFGIVTGVFDCEFSSLISLEGSPREVGSDFYCNSNSKLASLKGGAVNVGGNFDCGFNDLTSLEGCPTRVGGAFYCCKNSLTSLEFSPKEIYSDFDCELNSLTSLKGAPIRVEGGFNCARNKMISLDGCPDSVEKFICHDNPIYEVYKLFKTLESYKESMDYKYLRGTDIVRGRFKKACEDAEIKMPDSIPGYEYIDL